MPYSPGPALVDPLLASEFMQISQVIAELESRIIPRFHAEPEKLRDGSWVYADGVDWDPGDGEGFYSYYNATWNFLNGAAAGGGDADAIHDNVAAEISILTEKVSPIGGDHILIEDSAAANVKKRIQITNLPAGGIPTHTGEVTGDTNLTVAVSAITNRTDVVAASADDVAIHDDSDGSFKKTNLSSITDAGYF